MTLSFIRNDYFVSGAEILEASEPEDAVQLWESAVVSR